MKTFSTVLLAVLFLSTNLANGAVRRVPSQYPTIQAAINASVNGDTVLVANSTYYENIRFQGKRIVVASTYLTTGDTSHISRTIINGSQPNHPDSGSVVYFISGEDTNSVLFGFTITGGTGTLWGTNSRSGGGIACRNSGARIRCNIIENNHVTSSTPATPGGGISGGPQTDNSWIIIDSNTIRYNSVTNSAASGEAVGGGISLTQNARIINNIIVSNTARSTQGAAIGGGAAFVCQQPRERYIIRNRIWHNKALAPTGTAIDGGEGGGLFVGDLPKAEIISNDIRYNEIESNATAGVEGWGGGVVLVNQTDETVFSQNCVSSNKAINNSLCRGAGIVVWNFDVPGGPRIINNIISTNTGGTWGGGLFTGGFVSDSTTIINNTLCNNSATQGGAIYVGYGAAYPSHATTVNSILWNNSSSIYVNTNSTATVRYSDVEGGYPGEGNIDVSPLFSDTLFHLSNSSLCIGAGIDSIQIGGKWFHAPPFCFFGGPRPNPLGSRPDIGACENPQGTPTSIEGPRSSLPRRFALEQNYPNPFNPVTNLQFSSVNRQLTILKVYDLLGREVATLVNEVKQPGTYVVPFDASNLASGVYLYRLEAGSFVETKRLLLLR